MVYMPCVAALLAPVSDINELHTDDASSHRAENLALFLPSLLPSTLHPQLRTTGLFPGLLDKEIRLREAQADDASSTRICYCSLRSQ